MENVFFQIIRSDEGCRSYMLADARSRQALIVDPSLAALESYVELVRRWKIQELLIADTHTHADHFSASAELSARASSEWKIKSGILMGEKTSSKRPTRRLKDGERIELGEGLTITVMETAGHTQDSICLLAAGGGERMLFTGDTLMIGSAGRTDFPGASAEDLYGSLGKLAGLGDATWIFPGHDYSGLLFSRIGAEKKLNPQLQMALSGLKTRFLEEKKVELLSGAAIVPKIVDFNSAERPQAPFMVPAAAVCARSAPSPSIQNASVEELQGILRNPAPKTAFIDVREPEEYESGHIPGLRNIPLSRAWMGWDELQSQGSVYFSCKSGMRSSMVASTLARLGLENAVNVSGGIQTWLARGFEITR